MIECQPGIALNTNLNELAGNRSRTCRFNWRRSILQTALNGHFRGFAFVYSLLKRRYKVIQRLVDLFSSFHGKSHCGAPTIPMRFW